MHNKHLISVCVCQILCRWVKLLPFEKGSRNTKCTDQAEGKRPKERTKQRQESWKLCADTIYAPRCCLLFGLLFFWGVCVTIWVLLWGSHFWTDTSKLCTQKYINKAAAGSVFLLNSHFRRFHADFQAPQSQPSMELISQSQAFSNIS